MRSNGSNQMDDFPGQISGLAVPSVPLSTAWLCMDCERIAACFYGSCPVCGSSSLLSICRILGGPLNGPKPQDPLRDPGRYSSGEHFSLGRKIDAAA